MYIDFIFCVKLFFVNCSKLHNGYHMFIQMRTIEDKNVGTNMTNQ